ncbi:MAG: hypothetical protein EA340_10775, partial [Nitriliruptor sp.]
MRSTGGPVERWSDRPVERWSDRPVERWSGGAIDRWSGGAVGQRPVSADAVQFGDQVLALHPGVGHPQLR